MTMTLCLDCGARRGGIGGSACLVCGSAALELRRGHALEQVDGMGGYKFRRCAHCGTVPAHDGVWLWVDGGNGWSHSEPDCETVEETNVDSLK